MPDFPGVTIDVRYFSDQWGPYNFEFSPLIPPGSSISSFTIKTFLGKIDKGSLFHNETETTLELIDNAACEIKNDTSIDVYFNFPSTYASALGTIHTLVFQLTLDNGGSHPFYFHQVRAYV